MIRVVVIDDSAYSRQTITSMLEEAPDIAVVARAGDGDEGLKQILTHSPDVVTLDLDMPRMDGFALLRILMVRRPTPVLVISSHAGRDDVFRALELGAVDFIAKPSPRASAEIRAIGEELVSKVRLVARLRRFPVVPRAPSVPVAKPGEALAPRRLIVVGASIGGPSAVSQILAELNARQPVAVVIAQHMPARFTQSFADRLDRISGFAVREARAGTVVRAGLALVAPGAAVTTVVRGSDGVLRARVDPPDPRVRFAPSVDRLFESAAAAMGSDVIAVVLTGMAGDGAAGVRAVKAARGTVVCEAPDTAIVPGMPEAAIATGAVDEIAPLAGIAAAISRRV
jgi:two-component system chemotaxis response regulator CheB